MDGVSLLVILACTLYIKVYTLYNTFPSVLSTEYKSIIWLKCNINKQSFEKKGW